MVHQPGYRSTSRNRLLQCLRGDPCRQRAVGVQSTLNSPRSPECEIRSGSRADHRADLGAGDGRYFAVSVDPAGHQILRALRRRKEISGEGVSAGRCTADRGMFRASAARHLEHYISTKQNINPANNFSRELFCGFDCKGLLRNPDP